MTFQETLDFLYSQLPVFHREGASAYKKDLSRTIAILDFLGNPQKGFKSIHIAGTNGKGSSSHFLASILQEAGYVTGLYTSPHIKHFGERIKINGIFIEEDYVINFVEQISHLFKEIKPSFFELTVAMAFQYFAEKKVDIAVIETGLGGRLDSTNVITPVLSLITNISFDHADLLGDTLDKIALEKAGIIKEEIPVVISERQPEVQEVFLTKAREMKSDILFASDKYKAEKVGIEKGKLCFQIESNSQKKIYRSGLTGNYQLKNIQGVLAAVDKLKETDFSIENLAVEIGISQVIENTGLKGRWQIINDKPLIVCDIAHNEGGIREVLETVNSLGFQDLHLIIGMVKDKDQKKVLTLLPNEAKYYFTQAHLPRALPATELHEKALEHKLYGEVFENVNEAIYAAKMNASEESLILVFGSTFVIAEVDNI